MTLGKRIGLGFGGCVVLTVIVSVWGIHGVGNIVENGKQSILGNHLQSEMLQREVDHLNWANAVATRLAEDHPSGLEVQMDPTQCAFGKWYYGEGRKNAERDLPVLASLFSAIEEPHKRLHASAAEIDKLLRTEKGKSPAVNVYLHKTKPELAKLQGLLREVGETTRKNTVSDSQMVSSAGSTRTGIGILALLALVAGMGIAWFLTRSMVGVLSSVSEKLASGAVQVSSASGQLSSASQ